VFSDYSNNIVMQSYPNGVSFDSFVNYLFSASSNRKAKCVFRLGMKTYFTDDFNSPPSNFYGDNIPDVYIQVKDAHHGYYF